MSLEKIDFNSGREECGCSGACVRATVVVLIFPKDPGYSVSEYRTLQQRTKEMQQSSWENGDGSAPFDDSTEFVNVYRPVATGFHGSGAIGEREVNFFFVGGEMKVSLLVADSPVGISCDWSMSRCERDTMNTLVLSRRRVDSGRV